MDNNNNIITKHKCHSIMLTQTNYCTRNITKINCNNNRNRVSYEKMTDLENQYPKSHTIISQNVE